MYMYTECICTIDMLIWGVDVYSIKYDTCSFSPYSFSMCCCGYMYMYAVELSGLAASQLLLPASPSPWGWGLLYPFMPCIIYLSSGMSPGLSGLRGKLDKRLKVLIFVLGVATFTCMSVFYCLMLVSSGHCTTMAFAIAVQWPIAIYSSV